MAVTDIAKGTKMTEDVVSACALLQRRIARYESSSSWLTEQAELALSEMVAHPDRTGNAHHLVRNALSNARKKMGRRAQLAGRHVRTVPWATGQTLCQGGEARVDLFDLIASLPTNDRRLLELSAQGLKAGEIGDLLALPVQRVRERLSRARGRARGLAREAA